MNDPVGPVGRKSTMILDGELPKADWMTEDWSPRLSETDSEIHTVWLGRPLGLDSLEGYAAVGIHVHFYGENFHADYREWIERNQHGGRLDLHPTVTATGWVRELSRYDVGWLNVLDSDNRGDLSAAGWNDLNLPARVGTYVTAGLPVILKDHRPSITAIRNLTDQHDIGLPFTTAAELHALLSDRDHVSRMSDAVRKVRRDFAFDTHVEKLTGFFRKLISG